MTRFIGVLIDNVWRLAEATSKKNKDGAIPYSLNGATGTASNGQWFDMTDYAKTETSRIEMIVQKNINLLARSASSRKVVEKIQSRMREQEENLAIAANQMENARRDPDDDFDSFLDDDVCNCQVCKAMRGENVGMRKRMIEFYGNPLDEIYPFIE